MKVSLYELLGMIKEGKAPKKIRAFGNFWIWNKEQEDYIQKNTGSAIFGLFCNYLECVIVNSLNDQVEIIEEDKKIEKLNIINGAVDGKWETGKSYNYTLSGLDTIIINKLNEIIDKLNEREENK